MLLLRNTTTICDYEPYELKTSLILKILIRAVTFVCSYLISQTRRMSTFRERHHQCKQLRLQSGFRSSSYSNPSTFQENNTV